MTIEARVGGTVLFDFEEEGKAEGEVLVVDAPRALEHTWLWPGEPPSTVRWELEPDEAGGTHLVPLHRPVRQGPAADYAAGWHVMLEALRLHVDGDDVAGLEPTTRGSPPYTAPPPTDGPTACLAPQARSASHADGDATICYTWRTEVDRMATTIAQRDLRNDSAEILRRVEAGEEFIVTRNGTPVAELRSAARRRGVSRARLNAAFTGVPTVDLQRLRADLDEGADPAMRDPWQARG